MDWTALLVGVFGGGGLTSLAIALVNKYRTPQQREKDEAEVTATITDVTDKLLHSISELSSKELESVQKSYELVIQNYKVILDDIKTDSERRDKELMSIINDNRQQAMRMEEKLDSEREVRKGLNAAINLAYDCEHIKGKSPEKCVVLQGRETGCENCSERQASTRKRKKKNDKNNIG